MKRALRLLPIGFLAFAVVALPARADVLYGTTRSGTLFTVNTTTGAGTPVATLTPCEPVSDLSSALGVDEENGVTEIEYDPLTHKSYAQGSDGSFCGTTFVLSTGNNISQVSTTGSLTGMEVVGGVWYDIAISDPGSPSRLETFNPDTGVSVLIGLTGIMGPMSGMAWNGATMYAVSGGMASKLYTINLMTGAATLVGSTGQQLGSLEFGPDGLLYAGGTGSDMSTLSATGAIVPVMSTGNIYRINTTTGAATLVGSTGAGEGITGLMLAPVPAEIPALSTLSLLALAVFLAIAGAIAIRM